MIQYKTTTVILLISIWSHNKPRLSDVVQFDLCTWSLGGLSMRIYVHDRHGTSTYMSFFLFINFHNVASAVQ